MPKFTDATIQQIFGREDAENEKPERLKQYFFKNRAYDNLVDDLPIRILVGHKGIGKSALLKIAYLEAQEKYDLCLWIQPNDLAGLGAGPQANFNQLIEHWKEGITNLIFSKLVEKYSSQPIQKAPERIRGVASTLIAAAQTWFEGKLGGVLNEGAERVKRKFLENRKIQVYLDDLDRGWEAKASDIRNISALLNAIRDLCGAENNLQFRLGLRTDVYSLVRTSDESTDKIEGNIISLSWENHEILVVIAKRVATYFGKAVDEHELVRLPQFEIAKLLHDVVEPRFRHVGKWEDAPIHRVLLSLTRRRPRDLVKLFYGGAQAAFRASSEIIKTEHLRSCFERYSNERLQDIINEFKTELPEVERLVFGMRPTRKEKVYQDYFLYTNDELVSKLREIMQRTRFSFTNGQIVDPVSLAQFLFKIDFIMARKYDKNRIITKLFDQRALLHRQMLETGFKWEVHPAYRWALQLEDIQQVIDRIALETD